MLVFRLTTRKDIKPTPFLALYALIYRYKIVYYYWRICCVADNIVIQILLIFNLTEIDEDFSAFRFDVSITTDNTYNLNIDIFLCRHVLILYLEFETIQDTFGIIIITTSSLPTTDFDKVKF